VTDNDTSPTLSSSSANQDDDETLADREVLPPSFHEQPQQRRPRSGSEGFDYLVFFAEQERHSYISTDNATATATAEEFVQQKYSNFVTPPTTIVHHPQSSSSSSDTDDSESMPPPQPRRPRSLSNPDCMRNMNPAAATAAAAVQPAHTDAVVPKLFFLPPHLLRKELAEARGAVVRKAAAAITNTTYHYHRYNTSNKTGIRSPPTIPEDSVYVPSNDDYDYCHHSTTNEGIEDRVESGDEYEDDEDNESDDDIDPEQGDDGIVVRDEYDSAITRRSDESISSSELLRRARARLMEDLLSETDIVNHSIDKNVTPLPHTLLKYKTVRVVQLLFTMHWKP
jgi:hypothetical protein